MDIQFTLGNSLMICGPSKSWKTTWVINLIEHQDVLFKDKIQKIYWFYGTWQRDYEKLKINNDDVIFKNGIDEENTIEANSIVVIDDLVAEMENNHNVTALFTKLVHHQNLFLVYESKLLSSK